MHITQDTFIVTGKRKQDFHEDIPDPLFLVDGEDAKLSSPSNIIGYLLRMTEAFLKDNPQYNKTKVKPSINDEFFEDFGDPVVTIRRGQLQPVNLGINGGKTPLPTVLPEMVPELENKFPDANILDSNMYMDFVQMGVLVNLYASTLSECENIGFSLYNLFMAASYDVLRIPFPFIQYSTPPTMTQTEVMEKHDDIYMLSFQWTIMYWDESVVLVKKNLLKYATITVKDDPMEQTIYRDNN